MSGGCGTNTEHDLIIDFSNSTAAQILPANGTGVNGTYNQELFTAEAERLIALYGQAKNGAKKPLYLYLAYMNVHGASGPPGTGLQAPAATVALYNRTTYDQYKVAGAMLTQLDEGVGRIAKALKQAGMYANSLIAFSCEFADPMASISCSDALYPRAAVGDNGGPLDHATNAPLRGGKHVSVWAT